MAGASRFCLCPEMLRWKSGAKVVLKTDKARTNCPRMQKKVLFVVFSAQSTV